MPLADTLHVIAEIAVAFAGFASLVSIIGSRRGRDTPVVDASRMRAMLEVVLLVAALAFVPILAHAAGLAERAAWQASALPFAVVLVVIVAVHTRRHFSLQYGYRASLAWRGIVGALWLTTLGAVLATLAGALGNGGFAYCTGLLTFLAYAGLLFTRLVVSFLEAAPPAGDVASVDARG